MNRKYPLVLTMLLTAHLMNAQGGPRVAAKLRALNNDTISYVKNVIVGNSERYVNRPFDSLLKDLPHKIESYGFYITSRSDVYFTTYLKFYTHSEIENKKAKRQNPLIITVTWKEKITTADINNAAVKLGGKWSASAYDFFKPRIIEKVSIVQYDY